MSKSNVEQNVETIRNLFPDQDINFFLTAQLLRIPDEYLDEVKTNEDKEKYAVPIAPEKAKSIADNFEINAQSALEVVVDNRQDGHEEEAKLKEGMAHEKLELSQALYDYVAWEKGGHPTSGPIFDAFKESAERYQVAHNNFNSINASYTQGRHDLYAEELSKALNNERKEGTLDYTEEEIADAVETIIRIEIDDKAAPFMQEEAQFFAKDITKTVLQCEFEYTQYRESAENRQDDATTIEPVKTHNLIFKAFNAEIDTDNVGKSQIKASVANFSEGKATHTLKAVKEDALERTPPKAIVPLDERKAKFTAEQELTFQTWGDSLKEQTNALQELQEGLEGHRAQAMSKTLATIEDNIKQQKALLETLRETSTYGNIPGEQAFNAALEYNQQALNVGNDVLKEQKEGRKSIDLERTNSASDLSEVAAQNTAAAEQGIAPVNQAGGLKRSGSSTILTHVAGGVRPDIQEAMDTAQRRFIEAIESYRSAISLEEQEAAKSTLMPFLEAGNQIPEKYGNVKKEIDGDFSVRSKPNTGVEAANEIEKYKSGEMKSSYSTHAGGVYLNTTNKMVLNTFYPKDSSDAQREQKGGNAALVKMQPEREELARTFAGYIQENHPTLNAFLSTAGKDKMDMADAPAIRRYGDVFLEMDPGFERRTEALETLEGFRTTVNELMERGSLDQEAVKQLAEWDVKATKIFKADLEALPDTRDLSVNNKRVTENITVGKGDDAISKADAIQQLETKIQRSQEIASSVEKQQEQLVAVDRVKETVQTEMQEERSQKEEEARVKAEKKALEERQEKIKNDHKAKIEEANKKWEEQKKASEKQPSKWSKFKKAFSRKKEAKPEDMEISGPFNVRRVSGVDTDATAEIGEMIKEGNPQKQTELEFHQMVKKQEALHGSLSLSGLEKEKHATEAVIDTIASMEYPDRKLQEAAKKYGLGAITVEDVVKHDAEQEKNSDRRTEEGTSLRNLVNLGLVSKDQARALHNKVKSGKHDAKHGEVSSGEDKVKQIKEQLEKEASQEKGISS